MAVLALFAPVLVVDVFHVLWLLDLNLTTTELPLTSAIMRGTRIVIKAGKSYERQEVEKETAMFQLFPLPNSPNCATQVLSICFTLRGPTTQPHRI